MTSHPDSDLRTPPPRSRGSAASAAMLVIGFVLISLNSRVAFGQVGPLAPVVGFGSTTVTILGLLPPLCMGVFAPVAPVLRRRIGDERGLFWASAVILCGAVLRVAGMPGLYAGTVVASIGVAIVNVLIPAFVRRRFPPRHVGTMMGVYALAMGAGSAMIAALVVPVARASGGSWQIAIGLAVVPAVLAAAGIAPQLAASGPRGAARSASHPRTRVVRTAVAWSLTAYFGFQTLLFYTTLAWLPSILVHAGVPAASAGGDEALFIAGLAVGGFIVPVLAASRSDQRAHILGVVAVCAIGFLGLLIAPAAAPALWSAVLGAGMGGGQALAGVLYARRGEDHDHVASLSTMAQTLGYLVAATGPVLAAWLRSATGGWSVPLLVFLVVLGVNAATSQRAGRDSRAGASARR